MKIKEYKNKNVLGTIEAIQFMPNDIKQSDVEAFCRGDDLLEKGLIDIEHELKMIEVDPPVSEGWILYSIEFIGAGYDPNDLVFKPRDMILRRVIDRKLLVWSIPLDTFERLYSELKE